MLSAKSLNVEHTTYTLCIIPHLCRGREERYRMGLVLKICVLLYYQYNRHALLPTHLGDYTGFHYYALCMQSVVSSQHLLCPANLWPIIVKSQTAYMHNVCFFITCVMPSEVDCRYLACRKQRQLLCG